MAFPLQPNQYSDAYVVARPTDNISGPRSSIELANHMTRVSSGSYDNRPGAYDSGERSYYQQHSGFGGFTHQERVDSQNDRVYKENNGDYPDRLHGNSAVRKSSVTKKPWYKFW